MSFQASESAIVHGFQGFYYELLRQKERALSLYFSAELSKDPEVNSEETTASPRQNEIEGAIVTIQKKLISVIENASEVMLIKSRIQTKMIETAKYVMTVLADEVFINLRWEGSKFWRFSLLEKQLFQSEIAGERFFSLLDDVTQNASSSNEEMAFLYFMSLSLGFKGRYRDLDNADEHISWYKDRLYAFFHNKPSRLFYPGRTHMIESCYDHTNLEDNSSNLPDVKFWSWSILSVIFVYIIISYCVWYSMTDEISYVLHKISEQIRQGPLV